jgi:3-phenylpropionate/cinnamic acid dioxygenase small subunit
VIAKTDAESLLFEEARLLDAGKYQDWLALYAAEATYWIPSWKSAGEPVSDPKRELSYIYLPRDMIRDYTTRMESGAAYVAQPILRMTRLVGNVMLDREQNDVVRSKWIMHIYRANAPELFSGDCEHRLVREEGKLKIAAKKVLLINDKFEFGYMPLV